MLQSLGHKKTQVKLQLSSSNGWARRQGLCVLEGDVKRNDTYGSFEPKALNHPLLINDLIFKEQSVP